MPAALFPDSRIDQRSITHAKNVEYLYEVYGLSIRSEIPLPELDSWAGNGRASVTIRWATPADTLDPIDNRPHADMDTDIRSVQRNTPTDMQLNWPGVGRARVRDGCEIVISPEEDVTHRFLRTHILGSALGVILQQRNVFCLHASAVSVNGHALLFAGPRGMGKSSIAAAFHAHGHHLLADDIAALDLRPDSPPDVRPGIPQLKLWPESVTTLNGDPSELPRISPKFEKRAQRLHDEPACDATPLVAIYLLDESDQVEIERVPANEAWFELLGNWYCARFGNDFLDATARIELFRQITGAAATVSLFRLYRPYDLARLPQIVNEVEKHARSLVCAP